MSKKFLGFQRKAVVLVLLFFQWSIVQGESPQVFTPNFSVDYAGWCGSPGISEGGADFNSGRVVSDNAYINISQISATIDLSGLQATAFTGNNWLNASFYMLSSAVQPKQNTYCDSGDTGGCDEIDFLETNGNKIFQSTMHLSTNNDGTTKGGRYEYAYTSAALDDACYDGNAITDDPSEGLHSLVGVIDPAEPFDMLIVFDYPDYTTMTVTISQDGGQSVDVHDLLNDGPAEGSDSVGEGLVKELMEEGWWIIASFWEGYSPKGPDSNPVFTGNCYSDDICEGGYKISNIKVTAESKAE